MSEIVKELHTQTIFLHMGPSHPAMHGCVRITLELDGERIENSEITIGYLHRAFEKMAELNTYNKVIPYTDRLNYVSPLINNVGFVLAVEKLLGIEVPERCQYIRVIVSELSRITDHLTCLGAASMELGAFSVFLYMIEARDLLWEIIEDITGARLTTTYTRVGGVSHDLPDNFKDKVKKFFPKIRELLKDCEGLLIKNRIFIDRLKGVGAISKEDAINFGLTGPVLRATGIEYDVRKENPYLVYDRLDFDIPVGTNGDNYDRFIVRVEEMYQSLKIIEQCIEQMPDGPVWVDDPRVFLPPKKAVYNTIESMIHHFKLIIEGPITPKGEVYFPVEGANGELGFYIVSNGKGKPYRCRVRAPCFSLLAALPTMIKGHLVADVIATFGMLNIILGELDR